MSAPTLTAPPLSVESLAALVEAYAENTTSWWDLVHFEPGERWWVRLHANDTVDVWLLTWVHATQTDLHDHGGSAGAFAVVAGTLEEVRPAGPAGSLIPTTIHAGEVRKVGRGVVHDVRNPSQARAVSIHAYSPPLVEMTFYQQSGSGPEPTKTVATQPGRSGR